jgi:hypothetical protein
MARRRRPAAGLEPFADLARKVQILERELAVQRQALDRLKELGPAPRRADTAPRPLARKTA